MRLLLKTFNTKLYLNFNLLTIINYKKEKKKMQDVNRGEQGDGLIVHEQGDVNRGTDLLFIYHLLF